MDRGIAADGIHFSYPRGVRVISDWSADFEPGTMSAVTGPSGSGKSTLLYILGLMHRQTRGEVFLAGVPSSQLRDGARAELRARLFGFVFQDAVLDPARTVGDNVIETALYTGRRRQDAAREAADLLEALGVSLRLEHRPGQISGGQAQRVALCRALLGAPRFIVADEPTGNLDAATRDLVVDTLRQRANDGACVIIATHDAEVAAACDARLVLEGRP